MANDKRLIDANALETAIQGTVSQVALDAPYDPEWFTRLAARQFEILKIIDDAPTVDAVEVVHGKWAIFEDGWNDEAIYECTVCKEAFVTIDGTPAENLWNYCPNCGAKMDGDGNG